MSGILLIGAAELVALKAAVERARKRPIPLSDTMHIANTIEQESDFVALSQRGRSWARKIRPQQVEIPIGYRVAITFEQQPAGMCLHLSVSTRTPTRSVPRPEAVAAIAVACGYPMEDYAGRSWLEEFEVNGQPGGHAVNVVIVTEPTQVGHA